MTKCPQAGLAGLGQEPIEPIEKTGEEKFYDGKV